MSLPSPFSFLAIAGILGLGTSLPAQSILEVPGQFATISAALSTATTGDTILVGPGTYNEAGLDFSGRQIVLLSTDGPAATVIDATGISGSPIVDVNFGEPAGTRVEGFTFTNASSVGGGGIIVGDAMGPGTCHLVVRDCVFEANASPNGGGAGIAVDADADVRIFDCVFSNGTATDGTGGGIFVSGGLSLFASPPSTVLVEGCTFVGNSAPIVTNPTANGSAMFIEDQATVTVRSCLFHDNMDGSVLRAEGFPFGGPLDVPTVEIENCTFTRNLGASIDIDDGAVVSVVNTIVRDNFAPDPIVGAGPILSTSLDLSYSNISGGPPAGTPGQFIVNESNNVDVDPLFVDPMADDFRLSLGSPMVEAGDPGRTILGTDAAGNPRLANGDLQPPLRNDIGAYEQPLFTLETSDAAPPAGSPFTLTAVPLTAPYVLTNATLFASVIENDILIPGFGQLLLEPTLLLSTDFSAGQLTGVNPGLLGLTLKFQAAVLVLDAVTARQTITLTNVVDVRLP